MTKKDYETIAMEIWRAGAMVDRNKIRQQAKTDRSRLIACGFVGLFSQDPDFDEETFMATCGL